MMVSWQLLLATSHLCNTINETFINRHCLLRVSTPVIDGGKHITNYPRQSKFDDDVNAPAFTIISYKQWDHLFVY